MIVYETDRLYARRFRREDALPLFRLGQDPDVIHSGLPTYRSELEAQAAVMAWSLQEEALVLIRKEDSAWIGMICLGDMNRYEGYLELEYALLPEFRGRGYAAETIRGIVRLAFEKKQARVIAAWVRSGNDRSVRTLEACGFIREGCLRRHARDGRDTLCYSMLREEWNMPHTHEN